METTPNLLIAANAKALADSLNTHEDDDWRYIARPYLQTGKYCIEVFDETGLYLGFL